VNEGKAGSGIKVVEGLYSSYYCSRKRWVNPEVFTRFDAGEGRKKK